jgi:hypothetical protein
MSQTSVVSILCAFAVASFDSLHIHKNYVLYRSLKLNIDLSVHEDIKLVISGYARINLKRQIRGSF